MKTKAEEMKIVLEGMQARQTLAELWKCQQSGARYLDKEMEAAKVKVDFRPDFKKVLQDTAHNCRETMADFVRIATQERIERICSERIEAAEALNQPLAMKIDGPEDADPLTVKVAA